MTPDDSELSVIETGPPDRPRIRIESPGIGSVLIETEAMLPSRTRALFLHSVARALDHIADTP
jgi:hypothetical protein